MSLISIGLSGINASSAAINTIGNNTANVDTAGYSRQQVLTTASAQIALGQGTGYIGTGTTLSDVRRIYNSYRHPIANHDRPQCGRCRLFRSGQQDRYAAVGQCDGYCHAAV